MKVKIIPIIQMTERHSIDLIKPKCSAISPPITLPATTIILLEIYPELDLVIINWLLITYCAQEIACFKYVDFHFSRFSVKGCK